MSTPVRTDPAPSITAPALGLIGAVVALLAGAWLMYAPFVLGYQPEGADWADPTLADFWTGLGLAVIALIAAIALATGLVAALRAHGVLRTPVRPAAAEPATASPAPRADDDELTALLRPLVAALSQDTAARAEPTNGATTNHRVSDPAER